MKKILPLIIILFTSCKPCQKLNFAINNDFFVKTLDCPENGNCSVELISNKSIEFKQDDFGSSYPVISEGNKTILKYTYSKTPILNTQDSNYTELIYAELNKEISEMELTGKELQNIKLHFGRLCFCKGETGYYAVNNGKFKITKTSKNSIKIALDFKISEVPQIISKIEETISLKSTATN